MERSEFSDEQILAILKEREAGKVAGSVSGARHTRADVLPLEANTAGIVLTKCSG